MVDVIRKRVILLAIISFVAFISTPSLFAQEPIPPTIIEDLGGAIELEIGTIRDLPITVYDDKPTGTYHIQVYGNTVRIGDWGIADMSSFKYYHVNILIWC